MSLCAQYKRVCALKVHGIHVFSKFLFLAERIPRPFIAMRPQLCFRLPRSAFQLRKLSSDRRTRGIPCLCFCEIFELSDVPWRCARKFLIFFYSRSRSIANSSNRIMLFATFRGKVHKIYSQTKPTHL